MSSGKSPCSASLISLSTRVHTHSLHHHYVVFRIVVCVHLIIKLPLPRHRVEQ
ncbi:hypothetical protein DAI22_08g142600 [Oryza sativa Japonica Group]|nr:hypothetical protein DAI22_08g142600 [Oryza sativa Japonica Group]